MKIYLSPLDSDERFELGSIKFRLDANGLCGQLELFSSSDGPKIEAATNYKVHPFGLILRTSASHGEDKAIDFTHTPET